MPTPFLGEIKMFAGNFAPAGWEFCHGQLMSILDNDALFNLIGTIYGGDGQNTFALPDMRGRVPVHMGTATFGTTFTIGEVSGVEEVTLTSQQIPVHNHALQGSAVNGAQASPGGAMLASSTVLTHYAPEIPAAQMATNAISPIGGSQPHSNMQPFLCIDFIIAVTGVFPPRN